MINVKEITIVRREGRAEQCDIEHKVNSWDDARFVLLRMADSAPTEGYDKTDFRIIFEDGFEYKGRYDLKHHTVEHPDLYEHVADNMLFHAGLSKPIWMTEDQYERALLGVDMRTYKDFCDKYLGIEMKK